MDHSNHAQVESQFAPKKAKTELPKGLFPEDEEESGILYWLFVLDVSLSSSLGICAKPDSRFHVLRPLMKVLEISCHGLVWIFGSFLVLISSHQLEMFQLCINLLLGESSY